MTPKIKLLSDHAINKIAAGEVIENPASVVKELVENSLDAKALDICIEIQGGGRQLIRISDNGFGMELEDALLSLKRHATSKISDVEDIHALTTMGFRGEAIPSIAAISHFKILTSTQDGRGNLVIVEGGQVLSQGVAPRAQGTTIEVQSLFFNVPVRKKFLKSPAVDAAEIYKTISLLSLAHPDVKFSLINDGKVQLSTHTSKEQNFEEKFKGRAKEILGEDFVDHCKWIDITTPHCHLQGLISIPTYTRHNRAAQHLFINKRSVISMAIGYAIRDGYGTSIPQGRHPAFALHFTIDGNFVDVNVHPQKKEVRLRQELLIREFIIKAVQNTLHQRDSIPTDYMPSLFPADEARFVSPVFAKAFQTANSDIEEDAPPPFYMGKGKENAYISKSPSFNHTFAPQKAYQEGHFEQIVGLDSQKFDCDINPLPLKVLGTIVDYILVDAAISHPLLKQFNNKSNQSGGLLLVSQREAHARIIFEKLLSSENGNIHPSQSLLIPHTIDVTPQEANAICTNLDYLNKIGICIKAFGSTTFLIDAIPQAFEKVNVQEFIKDIICDLTHEISCHKTVIEENKLKKTALAASKASISANRKLSMQEADALLCDLCKCKTPLFSPTGKPTMAFLSPDDILRHF